MVGASLMLEDRREPVAATATGRYVNTVNLVNPQISLDPIPDLAGESPDGKLFYIAARGPLPLSGDQHASTGTTPGVLVLELLQDGRTGAVRGLARISNIDAGKVERADADGIRVRMPGFRGK